MIHAKIYINGQFMDQQAEKRATRNNPALLSEEVGTYPLATEEEAESAIIAASQALVSWKSLSGTARGEIMFRAAQLLENEVMDVAKLMSREMGKPIGESIG